ncbi:MAG: DUF4129 domain-containing protein [Roseiflexaceae bacterium]|nr:DUF4129 domain-containing protein [Roseiflexaceae bacterium]
MQVSPPRTIFLLAVAIFEASLPALIVTIAGGAAWALLIGAVLWGALLARLAERALPEELQRLVLLALALLSSIWVMKAAAGGGLGPLDGWGALFSAGAGAAYVTGLAALYCFWRGSLLLEHDNTTIAQLFSRLVIALIVILILGGVASALDRAVLVAATGQVITFFAAGLVALALAGFTDTPGRRSDWRGVAMLLGAIAAILLGGVLLAALLGGALLELLATVWQVIAFGLLILLTPLIMLISWALTAFIDQLGSSSFVEFFEQLRRGLDQVAVENANAAGMPIWIDLALRGFCLLIPILIIVLLFLRIRRTKRGNRRSDEQRESVLSWSGIGEDLGGLLNGLRRRDAEGLRAALGRLRGGDPATRIRRAYIRLLLDAEAREQQRAPAQTPREFAPAAASALGQNAAVQRLTSAYERARYAPASATQAEADQAEQAIEQLKRKA